MRKVLKTIFIFLLITGWFFNDYFPIWQNPRIPPEVKIAKAQGNESAMMVYAKGTATTPYYRLWNEATNTWGSEGSATAVSGTIQFMILRFSRTRNEGILGTLDSIGAIRTQIWNGTSWSTTTLHANVGTTNDIYRGFDIAYETSGDRAIIVFNDANSADPAYQIWNGSSWSTKTSITAPPTTGTPYWIELASNPLSSSNEIAMMLIDANVDVYGMIWTGSTWSNMGVTTVWDATGAIATRESIDVAYEQNSGRAMFIWADATQTDQYYRIWNGSTLTSNTLLDITASGGVGNWIRLVPRPNSNELMYGVQDAGSDLNTRKWSGSAWDTATQHPEHDAGVEQATTRTFDIAWETYSANSGKAWLIWGDGSYHSRKQWSGTAWGTATTAGDDTAWIRLEAQPTSGTFFNMIFQDSGSQSDDILEQHLVDGGTAWSTLFTVWAGAVVEVTYEPFDIASMRYVPPPTFEQSAYRLFNNLDSTDVGTALADQNAAATLGSSGAAFRLRLLLHIGTAQLNLNGQSFKLQFSQRGVDNLCDTAFSGETYADITAATVIAYNNNPTPADGAALTANANDPTHDTDTIVNQTYEELNNFTNSQAAIPIGQDGKWDFSLKDNSAPTGTSYCFRVVKADNSLLNTYTVIPEITTVSNTAPIVSNVKLNNQNNIDLTENTTTSVSATADISDLSGCSTITGVTAKIYRSGVTNGKDCTTNENNCYSVASCTQTSCVGNNAVYTCTIDMQFHADPTDSGTPWTAEYWRVYLEATDSGGLTGSGYSPADAPDVNSLLALEVTGSINYGSLNPGDKNDPLDKITTVTATGNVSLDVILYGTQLCTDYPTCVVHTISVNKQKYALSPSTPYSSGTSLLGDPGAEAELNCPKTIDSSNKQTKNIWWGIEIPNPQASGSYTGQNTFIGVKNETPWP